ncbi:MAG: hypothetical protein D6687_00430 [Acidobacteria bacterium]|jgi:hypothetical protein|nr:MAG: hypothetical protein D6687_00430 [Acidobacteriota bacterium]GIU81063.1 MAG: hypothetical protein KatS3mg006_0127 [Pyrinomonadaceae bacterium]
MKIGNIQSGSNFRYVGRVLTKNDIENPPSLNDYAVGRFVKIKIREEETEAFGVIFNNILNSPAYTNYLPIVPEQDERKILMPDSMIDTATLIEISFVGLAKNNSFSQINQESSIPPIPVYSEILKASDEEIKKLHQNNGKLQIRYLDLLRSHSERNFEIVFREIIKQLKNLFPKENMKLEVIFRSFVLSNGLFFPNQPRR